MTVVGQRPKDVPLVVELEKGPVKNQILAETEALLAHKKIHPENPIKRFSTGEWVDTLTPTHAFFEDTGYRYPNNKRHTVSLYINLVKAQVFLIEQKVF